MDAFRNKVPKKKISHRCDAVVSAVEYAGTSRDTVSCHNHYVPRVGRQRCTTYPHHLGTNVRTVLSPNKRTCPIQVRDCTGSGGSSSGVSGCFPMTEGGGGRGGDNQQVYPQKQSFRKVDSGGAVRALLEMGSILRRFVRCGDKRRGVSRTTHTCLYRYTCLYR